MDQPVTTNSGKIFWRGVYKTRDEAVHMRDR
jgi:hypothetical protein